MDTGIGEGRLRLFFFPGAPFALGREAAAFSGVLRGGGAAGSAGVSAGASAGTGGGAASAFSAGGKGMASRGSGAGDWF